MTRKNWLLREGELHNVSTHWRYAEKGIVVKYTQNSTGSIF